MQNKLSDLELDLVAGGKVAGLPGAPGVPGAPAPKTGGIGIGGNAAGPNAKGGAGIGNLFGS